MLHPPSLHPLKLPKPFQVAPSWGLSAQVHELMGKLYSFKLPNKVYSNWPNATFLGFPCAWRMRIVLISKQSDGDDSDSDSLWSFQRYFSWRLNASTYVISIHILWLCLLLIYLTLANIKISQRRVAFTVTHPSSVTEYLQAMILEVGNLTLFIKFCSLISCTELWNPSVLPLFSSSHLLFGSRSGMTLE